MLLLAGAGYVASLPAGTDVQQQHEVRAVGHEAVYGILVREPKKNKNKGNGGAGKSTSRSLNIHEHLSLPTRACHIMVVRCCKDPVLTLHATNSCCWQRNCRCRR